MKNSVEPQGSCKTNPKPVSWNRLILMALIALILHLPTFNAYAQTRTISGVIKDDQGVTLPGASVVVKGSNVGASADANGKFTLVVPANAKTLSVSFLGYKTRDIDLTGGGTGLIDIVLESSSMAIEGVVVVGYGTQRKANLTGAVSAVSGKELGRSPVTNPVTMLQGKMPGLRIVQGLGQPGAENVQIRVRGQGTYSSAGSDPLILIDGVPGSLTNLNPNDIESISVLKDAASASIYGARAANGVLLVTTKAGTEGTSKIEYSGNFAIHTPTRMLKLVTNSAEYMRLFNEAKKNSGLSERYPDDAIKLYENATDRTKYPNFDWLDYMFNPAFVQSHNLSLSGGTKGTTYNITLGYVNQPGVMRGFQFDKYNFRSNLKSQFKPWATIGVNLAMEQGKTKQPRQGQDDTFLSTLAQAPTYAPFMPDGKYVDRAYPFESHNKNTVAIVENNVLKNTTNYDVAPQLWAEITMAKGLIFYTKAALNYAAWEEKDWRPVVPIYNFITGKPAGTLDVGTQGLTSSSNRSYYTNFFTYLKYDFTLGENHNMGAQAGYSQEYSNYRTLSGYRPKYITNLLQELDAGTTTDMENSGNTTEWALQSIFGRFNYNFKERYLFEANVRYDGTSRIAKAYRWGLFPSFSAGWRLTEEDFIRNADMSWLSNAKIRASYGMLGNQNIGLYPYQLLLPYTGAYPFDNSALSPGVAQTGLSNDKIKWESTSITDIGIDLLLFGKLSVTYDWYRKHTYDILRRAQVSATLGLGAPMINSGDMLNVGHELNVQYNDKIDKGIFAGLTYGCGFNLDVFRNKLINFGTKEIDGYNLRENNLPYNSFYMLEKIGVFQTPEEVKNSPKQFNDNTKPGDLKYRDANGDGKINSDDRVVISGRFPKFEYAFNGNVAWKGFDFSFLFQGVQGRKIFTDGWGLEPFIQGTPPTEDYAKNRWTGPGTSNENPRLYFGWEGSNPNRRASTWYLQDASYLRLKSLTLGYTLPARITKKAAINRIRCYFSADNLLTFTKFKGLDPERAGDGRFAQYPQNKALSLGINVEF